MYIFESNNLSSRIDKMEGGLMHVTDYALLNKDIKVRCNYKKIENED